MKKILLGMSGGVDSSVSAVLLMEAGWDVVGFTVRMGAGKNVSGCFNDEAVSEAAAVCRQLGIPHHSADVTERFQKHVIEDFAAGYARCRTPNPCVECNRYIKFGIMREYADLYGCTHMATGHYARTAYSEKYSMRVLRKARSPKDQSYFLYNIRKEVLDTLVFPLGEFASKDEVRAIAARKGLSAATKPDSEDICFVPDGDYRRFLEDNGYVTPSEGDVYHVNGRKLGRHSGLYGYTTGQRKGLGIAYSNAIYVVGHDTENNVLLVGDEKDLYRESFTVRDLNWLAGDIPGGEIRATVKTRHTRLENPATVRIIGEGRAVVELDVPRKLITPGQSAVFYDGDIVLGGGKIV